MKPQDHETSIRQTFDSACKNVLKCRARDCYRKLKRQTDNEAVFSELTTRDYNSLAITDKYFTDEYVFSVLGEIIGVSDVDLAEALNTLSTDRRDIVLMSYFFDMTDREIAERLNMARRTVAYRRKRSLNTLKEHMERED